MIKLKKKKGRTLLHQACEGGHLELVNKLVSEFGCDPMALSDTGDTPLHVAAALVRRKWQESSSLHTIAQ